MVKTYTGLRGQINYVKNCIAIKKHLGKDASFEEEVITEWRRYLLGGDKHHLWIAHSAALRPKKVVPDPLMANKAFFNRS